MTGERRHGQALQQMASVFALLLNFGALIWFAATLNARVGELQTTIAEQKTAATIIADRVIKNSIDIEVLKTQQRRSGR